MKAEMRQKLAQEPFPEKIRKVAQLIRLTKSFPKCRKAASGKIHCAITPGRRSGFQAAGLRRPVRFAVICFVLGRVALAGRVFMA